MCCSNGSFVLEARYTLGYRWTHAMPHCALSVSLLALHVYCATIWCMRDYIHCFHAVLFCPLVFIDFIDKGTCHHRKLFSHVSEEAVLQSVETLFEIICCITYSMDCMGSLCYTAAAKVTYCMLLHNC